jgi:uncharacterized membrane protein
MDYFLVKWLHILSAMLLFGTGLGTAFFKFTADLGGNLATIADTNRRVVLADWLFTAPTVVLQPLTGYWLARLAGYPATAPWLAASLALYLLAGACWLPVAWLQIRMRNDSAAALASGLPLPERYRRDARAWFWLGWPAFVAMAGVLYLMTAKPALGV